MRGTAAFKEWLAARPDRNKLDSHADRMSRQYKVPAHKRVGLQKYYLHAVKRMRMKAERIAFEQREGGHDTAIVQFTKKQGGQFGVYITI